MFGIFGEQFWRGQSMTNAMEAGAARGEAVALEQLLQEAKKENVRQERVIKAQTVVLKKMLEIIRILNPKHPFANKETVNQELATAFDKN